MWDWILPINKGKWFDFYGFRVTVKSDDDGVLEDVQRDFSYFSKGPGKKSALLEVISESVPNALLPQMKATLQSPRNIVYMWSVPRKIVIRHNAHPADDKYLPCLGSICLPSDSAFRSGIGGPLIRP